MDDRKDLSDYETLTPLIHNRPKPDSGNLQKRSCFIGISVKLRQQCNAYTGSHYFPSEPIGTIVNGWRNEDIQAQSFAAESFDLVVSLDVTEHVFSPQLMFSEIFRTLKSGGLYISTFPIRKALVEPTTQLAILLEDGSIEHLKKPEYHGNPIDGKGALVTWDYGYDIHKRISEWAPFAVEIMRFCDARHGIIGEYTEVVVCRKC